MAQVSNWQLLTVAANGQSASALAGNLDLIDRLAMSWHRRPRPWLDAGVPRYSALVHAFNVKLPFHEHRATLSV